MSRPATLLPIDRAPAEALRLLEELRSAVRSGPNAPAAYAEAEVERWGAAVRSGSLEGRLLIGPKDEAIALAHWETGAGLPRRVVWTFTSEYSTLATARTFLEALDAEGRLLGLRPWEFVPPPPGAEGLLRSAGFRSYVRRDLIRPTALGRPPRPMVPAEIAIAPLRAEDETELARLLGRAYRDNPVDRALFVTRADPVEEARASVEALLRGGVGRWVPEASFGARREGRLVGATILCDHHGPLVAEVMTDPDHRRRGLARRLLVETLEAWQDLDARAVRLVVTEGNDRAEALYRSLGFADDPAAVGAVWLRPEVVAQIPAYPDDPGPA